MRFLFALVLISASCSAADLYHVAGAVINTHTHAPVPHVQVYFHKIGKLGPHEPFVTADDGKFAFDVPEGSYILTAGTRTDSETYGAENKAENGFGSRVIVGAGYDTSNLQFNWQAPAAIAGRIVDATGEPVESALVQLIRASVVRGRMVTRTFRWARSDDRGEYRFGPIPGGGRYYLAVTGTPWYDRSAPISLGPGTDNTTPSLAFVPIYYPNTSNAAGASPIVVAPGEEAKVEFTLMPAAGARVTVMPTGNSDLKGTVSLTRDGIEGVESYQQTENLAMMPNFPAHAVPSVPPGHYEVWVTGKSGTASLSGHAPIDVNGLDVAVEVPLHPESAVGGTLRITGPKPPRPFVTLTPELIGTPTSASMQPDGTFSFPAVAHGKYRIGVSGTSGVISQIAVAGAEFRDGVLTVTAGEKIDMSLVLSTDSGQVSGVVKSGDKPVPAALVVLVPIDQPGNIARYQGNQTESDGSFRYISIIVGEYYAFAVGDTGFEYANPIAVRPYLANARKITVSASQSLTNLEISLAAQ